MSTSLMFLKAINSDALSWYHSGNCFQAHHLFAVALQEVLRLCTVEKNADDEHNTKTYQPCGRLPSISDFVLPCSIRPLFHSQGTSDFDKSHDSLHGVYIGAFTLHDEMFDNLEEITAVLLFNLALMRHNLGITLNRTKEVNEALKIYQQSLYLLESSSSLGFEGSSVLHLVKAACYNNIAHIYTHSLSNPKEAAILLHRLQCILNEIVRVRDGKHFFEQSDYDLFICNILFDMRFGLGTHSGAA